MLSFMWLTDFTCDEADLSEATLRSVSGSHSTDLVSGIYLLVAAQEVVTDALLDGADLGEILLQ